MTGPLSTLQLTTQKITRRSRDPHLSLEALLSEKEKSTFLAAVRKLRLDMLQVSDVKSELFNIHLQYNLKTLLECTREIQACREAQFPGLARNTSLPISQALHEYEFELTRLFAWLLKSFPAFIAQRQPLPPLFRDENFTIVSIFISKARAVLLKKKINPALITIALNPFHIFNGNGHITVYKDFKYLYFYKKAFSKFLRSHHIDHQKLCRFLHEQKNNSLAFLQWQTKNINDELLKSKKLVSRIIHYYDYLRVMQQYQPVVGPYMLDGEGSITMLRNWLLAEVEYSEKQYFYQASEKIQHETESEAEKIEKMETSFSVSELAYFFRLLKENDMLMVESQATLMRFVSKTFRTARTKDISAESLRKKSWIIEPATQVTIKNFLLKLLNYVRESAA